MEKVKSIVLSICLIYLSTLLNINSKEQEKSLLWKISGNGLKKSSYIFGTFHVEYQKVFEIGDSAYLALKNCDYFANEVNFDSLDFYDFTDFIEEPSYSSINYDSLFTPEELEQINSILIKNTGRKLNYYNRSNFKYLFEAFLNFKDVGVKRETVLDAHLYHIAKCLGKEIGGIENYDEQLILDENEEVDLSKLKETIMNFIKNDETGKIIKNYIEQDIESLNNLLNEYQSQDFYKKNIVDRNKVMATRIKDIIKSKSLFFAVGAGHLGGEEGLIELLKKEGYKLEPVKKVIGEISKNFSFNSKKVKWIKNEIDMFGISLELPGRIMMGDLKGNSGYEYKDIGSGINYEINALPLIVKSKDSINLFLDSMLKRIELIPTSVIKSKKKLKNGQYLGYEIEVYIMDKYYRSRLIVQNEIFYSFAASTFILNYKNNDFDRFYNSIEINKPKSKLWQRFNFDGDDFSLELPWHPISNTKLLGSNSGISRINYFTTYDYQDKQMYNIISYKLNNGYFIFDDEKFQDLVRFYFEKKFKTDEYDTLSYIEKGFSTFKIEKRSTDGLYYVNTIGINRLNYIFLIIGTNIKDSSSSSIERVMNSIEFKYKRNDNYSTFTLEDCEMLLSSEPKLDTVYLFDNDDYYYSRRFENSKNYKSFDSISGLSWFYSKSEFNEYYNAENDTSDLFSNIEYQIFSGDSLVNSSYELSDTIKSLNYTLANSESNKILTKGKIIISGKNYYHLYCEGIKEIMDINDVDLKLQKFKTNNTDFTWTSIQSKADIAIKALKSNNQTEITKLKQTIDGINFRDSHFKDLQEILLSNINENESKISFKEILIEKLFDIDSINSSKFFMENYDSLATDQRLAVKICLALSRIPNNESLKFTLNRIKKLTNDSSGFFPFYQYFNNIDKMSRLYLDYLPNLMELLKNRNFLNHLLKMLINSIIEEKVDSKILKDYESFIVTLAEQELLNLKDTTDKDNPLYFKYYINDNIKQLSLLLISISSNKESYDFFQKIKDHDDFQIKIISLIGRLNFKDSLDTNLILNAATDLTLRLYLYTALKISNQLDYFPKEFKTQEHLAAATLQEFFMIEQDVADTLILLKKEIINIDDSSYLYYIYDARFEEEDYKYIGWVGPYPITENPDKLIIIPDNVNTFYYLKDEDKKLDEIIKQIIEYHESD